jgi:hypothetical protein
MRADDITWIEETAMDIGAGARQIAVPEGSSGRLIGLITMRNRVRICLRDISTSYGTQPALLSTTTYI